MKFGLSEDIITGVQSVFENSLKVDKVFIFGSRAKGNYRPGSDIDLAIKGTEITEKDILNLHIKLSELDIPYKVDLLNYHTIKEPELKAHIDRVGIEFYSRWKEYEFSELLVDNSISYGIVQPGSHTEIDSVPVIRVNNIRDGKIKTEDVMKVASAIESNYKRTRLIGGELLITVVGSVGECAIVPDSLRGWNVARAVSVARIKNEFDTRFIKYAFQTDDIKHQMYGSTNDTVQPTLNLSQLKELKFLIPSLYEQTAIASILSSLDDKIDLLQRQNKTLEQLAETLFRQWFVEEADESWEERVLVDIADHGKEGVNPSNFPSTFFHHYSLPAFDEGRIPKIEIGSEILSNKYKVVPNSILISKLNPRFPRIWALFGAPIPDNSICSTEFQIIKPKNISDFSFIYYFLKSNSTIQELANAAGGTSGSHQRVSPSDIFNLVFKYPPKNKIQSFHSIVKEHLLKINGNLKQVQSLTNLRDSFLPKIMSGEVKVLEPSIVHK